MVEGREAGPWDVVQAWLELSSLVLGRLAAYVESAPSEALFVAFRSLNESLATYTETVGHWHEVSIQEGIRTTQDAERRRWAREIHDRFGNWISLTIRQLDLYEIYRELDPQKADEKIVEIRTVLNDLLESTRRLMSDLRLETPVRNATLALRAFVRTIDPGLSAHVAVDGDEELIPIDLRDELFVVMREALRNVFAHAEATTASALLQISADQVVAVVEDNGAGFDVDVDLPSERRTGLDSMRERIELLGGRLVVASRPARGTRIEITVPFPESG
jgi:signal transduction histidine kinase